MAAAAATLRLVSYNPLTMKGERRGARRSSRGKEPRSRSRGEMTRYGSIGDEARSTRQLELPLASPGRCRSRTSPRCSAYRPDCKDEEDFCG